MDTITTEFIKKDKILFNDDKTIYSLLSIPSKYDQEENEDNKDDWGYSEKDFISLMLEKEVFIGEDIVRISFFDEDKYGCEYCDYDDKDGSELDSYVFRLKDAYEIFLKDCYNAYLNGDDFEINDNIQWIRYNAMHAWITSKYEVKINEDNFWFTCGDN